MPADPPPADPPPADPPPADPPPADPPLADPPPAGSAQAGGAPSPDPPWPAARTKIRRDAFAIAAATGAYGVSFGAVALAGGLDVWQAMVLAAVMFSGGSQFGLVGVVAAGGAPLAGAATAIMLGVRNALYGLKLAPLLRVSGWRRLIVAQLVIDESTAMSLGRRNERESREGFYATGILLFILWNLGTLVGAVGASVLADPRVFGLDTAAPAAFLALLAPRLRGREPVALALGGALVAILAVPFVPVGVPVLVAAALGVVVGLWPRRS